MKYLAIRAACLWILIFGIACEHAEPTSLGAVSRDAVQRFSCPDSESRDASGGRVRRLTRDEWIASVRAVLGEQSLNDPEIEAAMAHVPRESPDDLVASFQDGYTSDHVRGLLLGAEAIARHVVTEASIRRKVFEACSEGADRACAARWLETTGLRLLRRPIGRARREALLDAFESEGAGRPGLRWLLTRTLLQPESLFHLEHSRACDSDGLSEGGTTCAHGMRVDAWTVASRLAFALTGQGPDQKLLRAASEGALEDLDAVRYQAERLLDTKAARRQLGAMLISWLGLNDIPNPNPLLVEELGVDPEGLAEEARQELIDFASHLILEEDANVEDLMTASVGFPRSERMAKLYGSEIAPGNEPVSLSQGHQGLLLRVAPLLSGQLSSSPILRGVYVLRRLLCETIPSPDFAVVNTRVSELEAVSRETHSTREAVTEITRTEECAVCHVRINSIGFALEEFGPLGRPREVEVVYSPKGEALARHAIDARVDDASFEPGAPSVLNGAEALNEALARGGLLRACMAQRLYTQSKLAPVEPSDHCVLANVEQALRDGGSVRQAWIDAVVHEGLFLPYDDKEAR